MNFSAVDCPKLKVNHASFTENEVSMFGTEVVVYCDVGYHQEGNDNYTASCNAEGAWDNHHKSCQREYDPNITSQA